jgi:YbgC/YbaW family acyl-CoA thioester hydrolase
MRRSDFRFAERLRVRWAEIDAQKIVFNGHYLMYVDTAVAGYWRALALPYAASMEHLGGDLYVKKATLEYHGSARMDDQVEVGIRCQRIGTSSLLFASGVFRQDTLLVSCELVYVFADPATQKSKPVPPALRELLEGFEAGRPCFEVQVGPWAALGVQASALRTEVFVEEQRIPAHLEWDAADADALHAVAHNRLGMPVATGRLLRHAPGVARIGRMAVSAPLRGGGLGRAVLDALVAAARERGDRQAVLHAQTSAAVFYRRSGFVERGEGFEEAGVPHIEMTRDL